MKKWRVIILIMLLALCLSACEKKLTTDTSNNVSENSSEDSRVETDTLEPSTVEPSTVEQPNEEAQPNGEAPATTEEPETSDVTFEFVTIPTEYKADDGTVIITGSYTYPVVTISDNEAAALKINEDITKETESYESSTRDILELAQSDYTNSLKTPDYTFIAYDSTMNIQLERANGNILSFSKSFSDYTGGAHGNHGVFGINYDLVTGERLTLENLSEDPAKFHSKVLDYLLNLAKGDSYEGRLNENYENDLEDMLLATDKWYFSKSGLTFFANPYELGCYAAGIIRFVIPYEDLNDLKTNYTYSGSYEREIPIGTEVKKDINGDGIEETIFFKIKDSSNNGDYNYTFTIDGKDCSEGLTMGFPNMESYYLIDLDTTDNYIEIALMDYGPSDDPMTYFYRYEDADNFKQLGSVTDLWSSDSCYLESNGIITANGRLSLLQTWFAPFRWKLGADGSITALEDVMYYPKAGSAQPNNILRDVMVYTSMDLSSEFKVLSQADGPVKFIATDNSNWVELQTRDESKLYLYMSDFSTIVSGEETMDASTVFDQLFMAD